MIYSNDVIEEIRSANEIVNVISSYISLRQKGSSYFGLCPFHNEKSPSFSVSPQRQMYHCFGCGESGNVYTFIMKMENFSFLEAVRFLAERVNYILPEFKNDDYEKKVRYKNKLLKLNVEAARFFYRNLVCTSAALKYLSDRQIDDATKKKFGLGYASSANSLYKYLSGLGASKNEMLDAGLIIDKSGKVFDRFFSRIMFPIFNIYGRIIGFGGRSLNDSKPKYLNSPETILFNKGANLYNINLACKSNEKSLILTEGYMDTISLYQAGFKNVAAVLGTALGIKHARLIKNHFESVILLFDSDEAGVKAVLRAIPILNSVGLDVKVLQVENAKDPDEYIKKFGAHAFSDLLAKAIDSIGFQIKLEKAKYNLENVSDKVKFTRAVSQIISGLQDTIQKEIYINEISKSLQIPSESIRNELDKQNINDRPIQNINKPAKNDTALEKAQMHLINIIASNPSFYQKLKDYINPRELHGIYKDLLICIYDMCEKNLEFDMAAIINNFEDAKMQSLAAQILDSKIIYDDYPKALNDIIKTIKRCNIDAKISSTVDVQLLKELIQEKKKIDDILFA